MKNYINKNTFEGRDSFTLGYSYNNKAGEKKTGFIPVNFKKELAKPETGLYQINSLMISCFKSKTGEGKLSLVINNYVPADGATAPKSPILRTWINKDKFGNWRIGAKNEFNNEVVYANLQVGFKKENTPMETEEAIFVDIKDCFLTGFDTKTGAAPKLVITDYAKVPKKDDSAEVTTATPVAEEVTPDVETNVDECPFDME